MMLIMVGDFFLILTQRSIWVKRIICVYVIFNTVANIEPAIFAIYNCKVGTDIELVEENGKKFFLDSNTGKIFKL